MIPSRYFTVLTSLFNWACKSLQCPWNGKDLNSLCVSPHQVFIFQAWNSTSLILCTDVWEQRLVTLILQKWLGNAEHLSGCCKRDLLWKKHRGANCYNALYMLICNCKHRTCYGKKAASLCLYKIHRNLTSWWRNENKHDLFQEKQSRWVFLWNFRRNTTSVGVLQNIHPYIHDDSGKPSGEYKPWNHQCSSPYKSTPESRLRTI